MEHGKMALILWCRSMSEGMSGVDIVDFGDSWQDGLGFCAIISRFVPTDVLNFSTLSPSARADNLNLAFSAADKVGVPRLLSVEDMADKRNIFTWITHLYHSLNPLMQNNMLVLRSGPSPAWKRETLRLVVNKFSLCSSKLVTPTSPKYVGDELQWTSLAGAHVALVPFSEVHKELRTGEFEKANCPVVALYMGTQLILLTDPSNPQDVNAWYTSLTERMIGSVVAPSPSSPSSTPSHEGWLFKRGDKGMSKGFKKRYFVLRDLKLRYGPKQFSGDDKLNEKMMYSLKLSTEIHPMPSVHQFAFAIELPQRSVILRAENKEVMDHWIDVLQKARESFLQQSVQLMPAREKEGMVQLDSALIPAGQYFAVCKQGILFLNENDNKSTQKGKIPLYESEAELCDTAGLQAVRITIGSRDARNSRVYTITGSTPEETLDWLDVINRQRQLMDSYVNSAAWPAPADDDEEEEGEAPAGGC